MVKICFALLMSGMFHNAIAQPAPEWFLNPGSPIAGRFDDIFFVNDTIGWAVNSIGEIYKTMNGTETWILQKDYPDYLRSVEFFDENVGFAGSLSGSLFKTEDGGTNWNTITATLPVAVDGICGMSVASDSVLYLCGVWHGPAFIYKSVDRGITWQYIDMSDYATTLVDIKFLDENRGFATGTDADFDLGGVILYTVDGGISWAPKVNTNYPYEYVWKIQVLDSLNMFGSIEDNTATNNSRMMLSSDGGMNWEILTLSEDYFNIEMVGFINPDTGWVGGWFDGAFETFDGGDTWDFNYFGNSLNRFFKLNDNLAYASGESIYVYSDTTYVVPVDTTQDTIIDTTTTSIPSILIPHAILDIFPNPSSDMISVSYYIDNNTFIDLTMYDMHGRKIYTFYHNKIAAGKYNSTFQHALPPGEYVITMHSHEGLLWKKVIVQ